MASLYDLNTDLLSTECQLAVRTLAGKDLESVMDVYSHLRLLQAAFLTLAKLICIYSTDTCCQFSYMLEILFSASKNDYVQAKTLSHVTPLNRARYVILYPLMM